MVDSGRGVLITTGLRDKRDAALHQRSKIHKSPGKLDERLGKYPGIKRAQCLDSIRFLAPVRVAEFVSPSSGKQGGLRNAMPRKRKAVSRLEPKRCPKC